MNRPGWRRLALGMLSGLAGGGAFAAVMKLDMAISGRRVDDFQLLAGFGPTQNRWRVVGPIIHTFNSISLGGIYAVVAVLLPGSGWRQGLMFALAENTLLWPVIIVLDRVHPAIKAGELPAYNRAWPFFVENLRHAAFGVVLGTVFERLTRRR